MTSPQRLALLKTGLGASFETCSDALGLQIAYPVT